jgi:PhnB protein
MEPVADKDFGDRIGSLTDPFGHIWIVATHKRPSGLEADRRFA